MVLALAGLSTMTRFLLMVWDMESTKMGGFFINQKGTGRVVRFLGVDIRPTFR